MLIMSKTPRPVVLEAYNGNLVAVASVTKALRADGSFAQNECPMSARFFLCELKNTAAADGDGAKRFVALHQQKFITANLKDGNELHARWANKVREWETFELVSLGMCDNGEKVALKAVNGNFVSCDLNRDFTLFAPDWATQPKEWETFVLHDAPCDKNPHFAPPNICGGPDESIVPVGHSRPKVNWFVKKICDLINATKVKLGRLPHLPYHGAFVALFACDSGDPEPTRPIDLDKVHILLGRRNFEPFHWKWAFPGGACEEKDKTFHDAALREFFEETGLIITDIPNVREVPLPRTRWFRIGEYFRGLILKLKFQNFLWDVQTFLFLTDEKIPVNNRMGEHGHEFNELRWVRVSDIETPEYKKELALGVRDVIRAFKRRIHSTP